MSRLAFIERGWAALGQRERRFVTLAATLLVLALGWWLALAPALRTLRAAPEEHARLNAQLQQMTALEAQARTLLAQPRANREDALRTLQDSLRQRIDEQHAQLITGAGGGNASVNLRAAPAAALADWLAQVRTNARARPREVHLAQAAAPANATPTATALAARINANLAVATRSSRGSGTATAPADGNDQDAAQPRWDGMIQLGLPAAQ
ncbi:MAG: type II secretion system protein GspM [Variovorax sp.]